MWELVAKHAALGEAADRRHGLESVRETVCLTNRAAEMGYKAAMVRTPHYYKNLVNNAAAQALYYRAVADQSKIPLIIYNWPQATGVDIPVGRGGRAFRAPEHRSRSRRARATSRR